MSDQIPQVQAERRVVVVAAAAAPRVAAAAAAPPVAGPAGQKAKHWMFTINNPVAAEKTLFPDGLPDFVKYIVYQVERGAEGTVHVQGYIQFSGTRTRKAITKISYNDVQIRKGSPGTKISNGSRLERGCW